MPGTARGWKAAGVCAYDGRAACRASVIGARRQGAMRRGGGFHFVNPTQFGPKEDLAKYPRTFENDCALLEKEGVDLIFAPTVEEMYGRAQATWVTVEGLSEKLDGRSRPGHFRGVTTVVSKLFHIVEPDVAFFGQKDAAQVAIIRRMVHDLEHSGRNRELPDCARAGWSGHEFAQCLSECRGRRRALVLHRLLEEVEKAFRRRRAERAEACPCGTRRDRCRSPKFASIILRSSIRRRSIRSNALRGKHWLRSRRM